MTGNPDSSWVEDSEQGPWCLQRPAGAWCRCDFSGTNLRGGPGKACLLGDRPSLTHGDGATAAGSRAAQLQRQNSVQGDRASYGVFPRWRYGLIFVHAEVTLGSREPVSMVLYQHCD